MRYMPNSNMASVVYRPYAICIITLFSALLILFATMLTDNKVEQISDIESPNRISVYLQWREDVDIDVWVKGPGDDPVGFQRQHGDVFDLVQDDQGGNNGFNNFENVFARNLPAGLYVVNLHYFGGSEHKPIEVAMLVKLQPQPGGSRVDLYKDIVKLVKIKQERTVIAFTVDKDGKVTDKSFLCHPLKEKQCL